MNLHARYGRRRYCKISLASAIAPGREYAMESPQSTIAP
jgi:hypothetical protein